MRGIRVVPPAGGTHGAAAVALGSGMAVHHILCPTDFSEASAHALDHAIALARHAGARLTVLHVFRPVIPSTGLEAVDHDTAQLLAPSDRQALLARVDAACRPAVEAGVAVDTVVVGGQPGREILAQASRAAADLIVIGTHGAGGFHRLILGSVTEKVLRSAACPVLTVPPRAGRSPVSFTHVLCAVDFSECSMQAVSAAAMMAETASARVTLVHVLEWPWHEPPAPEMPGVPPAQAQALVEYRRYLEASAAERLADVAARAMPGRDVATAVRFGKAYVELLAAARDGRADLIVLGVRGRSALDLGFFGSTANHVVRGAVCPVLTIRA